MLRKTFVVATVSALAIMAFPAAADSGRLRDPRGDVRMSAPPPRSDYDITWVSRGHRHGGFMHVVHVRGTIGHIASGRGALPVMYLKVPGVTSDNSSCDFVIDELPPNVSPNTTGNWKYFVRTCTNGPTQEVVGRVGAKRFGDHRIRLLFWPKAIGSPDRYRWAAAIPLETDTPPADRAPDRGFETHVVG